VTLFAELALFCDAESRSAPMQMAIDEALLRNNDSIPVLRFYTWSAPSASFGYFSRFGDVQQLAPARQLVRRWTGGGVVLHGRDLTYSLIVRRGNPACSLRPIEFYRSVHQTISRTFSNVGMSTALASHSQSRVSDVCFANPVEADVLLGAVKIAGAAQRRTREGLLHQGSIQLQNLPHDFGDHLASNLSADVRNYSLGKDVLVRAELIAAERYSRPEWLMMR
jgi:lipoate-protein ligase A